MPKPVAIVDCNNFYASCERVFAPELKGVPIIILSNNDGMIIARSNEAKALGIGMGEPLFKVKPIVEKHGVKVFSSNYFLYGDMSHRVMTTLEQFSPDIEIYSIDEAFLNLEGFETWTTLADYGQHIKQTVAQWTGIPVSVGIASTKTLAKLANHRAKKNPDLRGVLNLMDSSNSEKFLRETEVSDIWGVGRQYTKFLNNHNIKTAYDLIAADDKWIRKYMTVMGLRTVYELRGIPCISLDRSPSPKKAIVSSRSFGVPVESIEHIKEAIACFTATAALKMRRQKSAATFISVFMRTNPFKKTPQYHNGVQARLEVPTDSTAELTKFALKGVEQIFRKGYIYNKVGVMLTGFVPYDRTQTSLFDSENRIKMAQITDTVDEINARWGRNTIFCAASGTQHIWKTKAELRSPQYTTDWNCLPNVG